MKYSVYRDENTVEKLEVFAQMRRVEFTKFPYLYHATPEGEEEYAKEFQLPGAIMITCSDNGVDVGVIAGYPHQYNLGASVEVEAELAEMGIAMEKIYYIAEYIVSEEYRNQGIGKQLVKMLLDLMKNEYSYALLITVERSLDDPDRPDGYHYQNGLREGTGFKRLKNEAVFPWLVKRKSGIYEEQNVVSFWIKDI